MNEPVPKADDLCPRNGRVGWAFRFRNSAGGFSDDLEKPDQRQIQLAVGVEVGAIFPSTMVTASRA